MSHFYLVHSSQFRLRLKAIDKIEEPSFWQCLTDYISSQPQVDSFQIDPRRGCITILHQNVEKEILRSINESQIATIKIPKQNKEKGFARARAGLRQDVKILDNKIRNFTDNELDLKSVVGIGLLGLGLFQTFRNGKFLPAGESLMASALRILTDGEEDNNDPDVTTVSEST